MNSVDRSSKAAAPLDPWQGERVPRDGHPSAQYFQTDHLRSDLGFRAVRGGAVTLASQAAKFLFSITATMILARLLTPQDYGLVGMVAVFIGFASLFKDLGLSAATVQRAQIDDGQVSTLFWLNAAMGVALTILLAAAAPLVARFYSEPRLIAVTVAAAAGFVLGGLVVQHESLLSRQMRFGALAVIEVLAMVAGAGMAIAWAWYGMGYWALVVSSLTGALVRAIAIWTACRWRPSWTMRTSEVRPMLRFGLNLTGFGIINYFSRNLDNLLIGRYWGPYQLGLYSRAYQLLLLPIDQINTPVAAVAIPLLSRLADDPVRYRETYLRILEKLAIVTMAGTAFMIATADWFVRLALGPQWAEVSLIFAFLGAAGLFQPVANTTGWLFITQGRTHHLFQIGLVGGVLIIVSFIAGLPWGAAGVAASYALTSICLLPLLFWWVGRVGPVTDRHIYRALMAPLAAAVSALLVAFMARTWAGLTAPLPGLCITLPIFGLAYLTVLAVIPGARRALRDFRPLIQLLTQRKGLAS